jgi:hypothetical protein
VKIWAGSTLRIPFVSKEERRILQKICVFFLQKCEELKNCSWVIWRGFFSCYRARKEIHDEAPMQPKKKKKKNQ